MRYWIAFFSFFFTLNGFTQWGGLDSSFNPGDTVIAKNACIGTGQALKDICQIPGGDFLIAAYGSPVYNSEQTNFLFRIAPDGERRTDWPQLPAGSFGAVNKIFYDSISGYTYLAGSFAQIPNMPAAPLIRLTPQGTVDVSFQVGFLSELADHILDLKVQSDGKIVCGGTFDFGALPIYGICRFLPDGSLDTAFSTAAGFEYYTTMQNVDIQPDGKILLTGRFMLGGQYDITGIKRLNSSGTIDNSFALDTALDGAFKTRLQANGKIFGVFLTNPNGAELYRLQSNGTIDPTFTSPEVGYVFVEDVYDIEEAPDGNVFVAGRYWMNGQYATKSMLKIAPDGSVDSLSFWLDEEDRLFDNDPAINGIAFGDDGSLYTVGYFPYISNIACGSVTKLTPQGKLAADFNRNTGFNLDVKKLALAPDEKIIAIGDFSKYNNHIRRQICRLQSNGEIDSTFNVLPDRNHSFSDVAVQPDGKVVVLNFANYDKIIRFNEDGSVDDSFQPGGLPFSMYRVVKVGPDGMLYVSGTSSSSSCKGIARLLQDGSLDPTFQLTGNTIDPYDFDFDSQGHIYAVTQGTVYKYAADGMYLPFSVIGFSFYDPASNQSRRLNRILVKDDNYIVIGGNFLVYALVNGSPYQTADIMVMDSTHGVKEEIFHLPQQGFTENNPLQTGVMAIVTSEDCRLYTAGDMLGYDSTQSYGLVGLFGDATINPDFTSGFESYAYVSDIELMDNNKLLVAGRFNAYEGRYKNNILRVNLAPVQYLYQDNDGDGYYGDSTLACLPPGSGWEKFLDKAGGTAWDCDDNNPDIHPGAIDTAPNGIDENCDGVDGNLLLSELTLSGVHIFPNPSTGIWNVETGVSARFTVYDLTGNVLLNRCSNSGTEKIALETAPAGLYLLKINIGTKVLTYRIIKQ